MFARLGFIAINSGIQTMQPMRLRPGAIRGTRHFLPHVGGIAFGVAGVRLGSVAGFGPEMIGGVPKS